MISANIAAYHNDVATLQTLVTQGVDMNIGDYDSRTPLHIASAYGNLETVLYLL